MLDELVMDNLDNLLEVLREHYEDADEVEKIIMRSALVAAGAEVAGGIVPGISLGALTAICTGAVWVMYGTICSHLGIQLHKNVLKLLARAALANIVSNLGTALLSSLVGMFIPGVSVAASAIIAFVTVYLAGYVFVMTLARLVQQTNDPKSFSDISEEQMQQTVEQVKVTSRDLKAAKSAYRHAQAS